MTSKAILFISLLITSGLSHGALAAPMIAVNGGPSAVAGVDVSVSVMNGPGNLTDWVTIAPAGSPATTYLSWVYLSGTQQPPSTPLTAATVTLKAPPTPGSYEARFLLNDGYSIAATTPLTITASRPPPQGGLTVQNFTIDPDPSKGHARGDVLEKTIDYFTDPTRTNPSIVVGYGVYPSGNGGLWLYVNDGSITGQWTSVPILSSGNCYERSRAITFSGQAYPNLVASCIDKIILFLNPGNVGGNPVTDAWQQQVLDSDQGAHQIRIADIDGDGKQDIVLSASAVLGVAPNFILYQNSPTNWSRIDGPRVNGSGSLQDDLDVIPVNGATSIVGPAADGSGVYWFSYPGSRAGTWPTHLLAAAGGNSMKGVAVSGGTLNGNSYVIVASNEDYPNPWPLSSTARTADTLRGAWSSRTGRCVVICSSKRRAEANPPSCYCRWSA